MNPNIALSFQRPRFDSTEGQRNALAIRNAQMQEAANAMQMQQAAQQMQTAQQRRNALSGFDLSTREGLQGAASAVGQFDPDYALKLTDRISKMKEDERAAMKADLELFDRYSVGLLNPGTYGATREQLVGIVPSAANSLPEQYDPAVVERITNQALGIKGILEQQRSDREYAFNKDKFKYTQEQDARNLSLKERDLKAKAASDQKADDRETAKARMELQKQYRSDKGVDTFRVVAGATKTLAKALDRAPNSAPATLAAGTAFMKLLDPGSVVRESELGMALGAQGLLGKWDSLMQRTDKGKVMSQAQAEEFKELTAQIYKAAEEEYKKTASFYANMAVDAGVDPEKVVQDYSLPPELFPAPEDVLVDETPKPKFLGWE